MDYEKTFKGQPDWLAPNYSDGYYLLPALAVLAWAVLGATLVFAACAMWQEARALMLAGLVTTTSKLTAVFLNAALGALAISWLWPYYQKRAAVRRLIAQMPVIEFRLKPRKATDYGNAGTKEQAAALAQARVEDVLDRAAHVFGCLHDLRIYVRKSEAQQALAVWYQCAAVVQQLDRAKHWLT